MATGTAAITHTSFPDNSTADGTQVITNFNDILTYVNNRNDGTDEWQVINVTATTAAAMTVSGNQATTAVQINNTATDGDPILTWALGGVVGFSAGIDDGDSDSFKMGLAAIGTTTWLKVPSTGLAVQFPDGTALLPSVSFISDPNTGMFSQGADNIGFSCNGTLALRVTSSRILILDGAVDGPAVSFINDDDTGMFSGGTNIISFSNGNALTMNIDANGIVTKPKQPSFLATVTSELSNVTGDGTAYTVVFGTEAFDIGSNFDGTSTFTAPVTGKYLLCCNISFDVDSDHDGQRVILQIVTSNRTYTFYNPMSFATTGVNTGISGSVVADMDASDTATIQFTVEGSTKDADVKSGGLSTFSGTLLS